MVAESSLVEHFYKDGLVKNLTFEAKGITNAEFWNDYFLIEICIYEFKFLPSCLIKVLNWISTTEHIIREVNSFNILCCLEYRYWPGKIIIANIYIFKF